MSEAADHEKITTEAEAVNPDVARALLELNTHNRPPKLRKIDQFARMMARDEWALNGESIKLSISNVLLDGQNRLYAVIKANVTIWTMVTRGLPDSAQDTMDSGIVRNAADVLTLNFDDLTHANEIAGAARIAMAHADGIQLASARYANTEVRDWVAQHPAIIDAPTLLPSADARLLPMSPSVRTYVAYRLAAINEEQAVTFLTQLAIGMAPTPRSPVVALKRRLTGDWGSTQKISVEQRLTAVFRAWNAWREERPMLRVMAPADGRASTWTEPH